MNDMALEAKAPQAVPPVLLRSPGGRKKPIYVPVKNVPGILMTIDKSRLYIDPQYQRRINDYLVARITANWSWVSCGTLLVSQRPNNGQYFVIDGQHRWKAATNLAHVRALPCLLFELDTIKDEAIGFLASNTERRFPTLRDQFKALLIAEDPTAHALAVLCNQYSRTISAPSSATTVSCVSDCMRLLGENTAAFQRIFPLAAEICAGYPIPGRMFRALHYLESHMPRRESLANDFWRRRLAKIGYVELYASIRQATIYEGNGHGRTCATGVLRVLNKGLRTPLEMTANGRRRAK